MKTKYDELNANVTTLHVGAHLLEYGFAVKSNSVSFYFVISSSLIYT